MNHAIIMMAGEGERFGGPVPKQFVEVEDQPLFLYVLEKYREMPAIDHIILVTSFEWIRYVETQIKSRELSERCTVVAGGRNRSESVRAGLRALAEYAGEEDVVLIHDVTHPLVDAAGIRKVIQKMDQHEAVTLVQREYDTVYRLNENQQLEAVLPRENIVSGASPEAFRFGRIHDIYESASKEELASMTSVGAIALSHGMTMAACETNILNLKITTRRDLELFRTILRGEQAHRKAREEAGCSCPD